MEAYPCPVKGCPNTMRVRPPWLCEDCFAKLPTDFRQFLAKEKAKAARRRLGSDAFGWAVQNAVRSLSG